MLPCISKVTRSSSRFPWGLQQPRWSASTNQEGSLVGLEDTGTDPGPMLVNFYAESFQTQTKQRAWCDTPTSQFVAQLQ